MLVLAWLHGIPAPVGSERLRCHRRRDKYHLGGAPYRHRLQEFLRGGTEMGTLTLSRFYAFHVFFIPGLIMAGVAIHVFLFRRAGAAGPPRTEPEVRSAAK